MEIWHESLLMSVIIKSGILKKLDLENSGNQLMKVMRNAVNLE